MRLHFLFFFINSKIMELLKLLSDTNLFKETCFLCFKKFAYNLDIYTVFKIQDESSTLSLSLAEIIKTLFPTEDFIFRNACDNCSDLIIKLYVLIHKRKLKTLALSCIVKKLEKEIEYYECSDSDFDKIDLKIQLPAYKDLLSNNHNFKARNTNSNKATEIQNFQESFSNNVENDILKFRCDICGESFNTAQILESHLSNHNNSEKACPNCSATFKNNEQYVLHLKSHKNKRKRKRIYHSCNDCNYKTLSKGTLQAHINKNHLHTRPHICQICFKGFFNKSNLNEHAKTHNTVKKEICEVCGCRFYHRKNLIEHLRLHSDTRPYECDICKKRFVTSGRRSDHIKRSHMERAECCMVCNKRYSLKKELMRHMKNVHLKS